MADHLPGAEDGESGSINFTPHRIREAVDKHTDLSWVPDTFDVGLVTQVNGVWTEPARFLATSLGLWMERLLAGVVRNYKLMGHEAVVTEMNNAGRSRAAIKEFTKAIYDEVLRMGYDAHEKRTASVLSPCTFLRESRFDAVSRYFESAVCGGRWATVSDEVLVGRLLLMCTVAVNQKPEAMHYVLENHITLIEDFPDSHNELTIVLRDLWAHAPINKAIAEQHLKKSFGSTLEAVQAFLSSRQVKGKSSSCACPGNAQCRLGRRRPPFTKTTICRAQPWAMHRETSPKSGVQVLDQWRESCASLAGTLPLLRCFNGPPPTLTRRLFTLTQTNPIPNPNPNPQPPTPSPTLTLTAGMLGDSSVRSSLLEAVKHGGELAVVDCLKYRTYTVKGKKRTSGIKHANAVRPCMIGRAVTGSWGRMSMRRQGEREAVLPGDNSVAPQLAKFPSRRVEAFIENCEQCGTTHKQQTVCVGGWVGGWVYGCGCVPT